jgi:hypothetical protein
MAGLPSKNILKSSHKSDVVGVARMTVGRELTFREDLSMEAEECPLLELLPGNYW